MNRALILGLLFGAISSVHAAEESVVVEAVKDFPEACLPVRQATLPFEWLHGQMIVAVTVNHHPLHFAVDTGAVFSAIDGKVAKSIGLGHGPLGANFTIRDSGGAEIEDIVRIDEIRFGGAIRTGSLTLVSAALPRGEDGILAPDLLRNFDVEFDPAHQVINLYKPHPCLDHVVFWTSDFARIHATRTDFDQMRIPVSIDSAPVRGVLDTGVAHTFIGVDATTAALGSAGLGPLHHMAAENGGELSGNEVRLDSFLIGNLNLVGPVVLANAHAPGWQFDYFQANPLIEAPGGSFNETPNGSLNNVGSFNGVASPRAARVDKSQVLIGNDILQNLHVLVDYRFWDIYVSKR